MILCCWGPLIGLSVHIRCIVSGHAKVKVKLSEYHAVKWRYSSMRSWPRH
jgi:hypothetical protein